MLQNNNNSSINKITKKILSSNKQRNVITILAIMLTTLLITVTITGAITFYNTNNAYKMVSTYGIDTDSYVDVDEDDVETLRQVNEIKDIGISKLASIDSVKNKELLSERVILQYSDKVARDMMSVIPIEGDYPKEELDIMLPTWVLEALGIDEKINQSINLDIVIDDEVQTKTFNLSGYYQSLLPRGSNQSKIFVSEKFIEKYSKNISDTKGSSVAFINFKNVNKNTTYDEINSKIKNITSLINSDNFKIHPKYEESITSSGDSIQMIAIILGLILVIFTGYLIIYNIFYISVNKDIRFYGLLKTIGTTSKQLKKIILRQAIILSFIGIPLGLILGYISSLYIIPLAMRGTVMQNIVKVPNDSYIFIISILFSLITIYISCNKPGKLASKVSPIEATRFVSDDLIKSNKKEKKGTDGAKIHKMAFGNIIKNKKRVYISIISISLSSLMVIFTISATLGIDEEEHASKQTTADITVRNDIGHFFGEEEYNPITQDIIDSIKELNISNDITPYYSAINYEQDGKIYDYGVKIKLEGKFKEEINSYKEDVNAYNTFSKVEEDIIDTKVRALKSDRIEEELSNVDIVDGTIDYEKFKTGKYIIYKIKDKETKALKAGDKIVLNFLIRDKDNNMTEIREEFEVMAIVYSDEKLGNNNLSFLNIEENKFKDIFNNYNNSISSVDINLLEGVDEKEADKMIQDVITKSDNYTLSMVSKTFYVEAIEEIKYIIGSLGIILSIIFGAIGIINIVNTVITGIFSRKIEFAMLESIGMTKKQIKNMIIFEGMYYIIFSSILIIPLGLLISMISPMILPMYGGFNYQIYIISVTSCIIINSIIMLSVPLIGYKIISKNSIVDRLRVFE